MDDDRQLLEAAARAAKYVVDWVPAWKAFRHRNPVPDSRGMQTFPWIPLDDDGDAMRLLVKLPGATLWISDIGVTVFLPHKPGEVGLKCDEYADEHGGDMSAATRRAIVRAAALCEPHQKGENNG